MTSLIEEIRQKVADEQFEFFKHAVDQSILREVQVQEVREAIANGEMIEDYPNDKYGASCLIGGLTPAQRVIHIQCSYPSRPFLALPDGVFALFVIMLKECSLSGSQFFKN